MTDRISGGSRFATGLLERLFQRADGDKNNVVSAEELAGLLPEDGGANTAVNVVSRHDQGDDGRLSLAEFKAVSLAPETMSSLLSVQEYKAANRNARRADDAAAVDELFARADLDGDGLLSRDEFAAERALQFAQALDNDEKLQHSFAAMPSAAEDGYFSKDEILVGRRLIDVLDPISPDDPDIDPALKERLQNIRRLTPQDSGGPVAPPAPPSDLETVLGNVVRNSEMTEALIARLIRQLEFGAVGSGKIEADRQA